MHITGQCIFRYCFHFNLLLHSFLELISVPGKLREIVVMGPFYRLGRQS